MSVLVLSISYVSSQENVMKWAEYNDKMYSGVNDMLVSSSKNAKETL